MQKNKPGFSIFFLTEMWERYGFYVLQSLLIFFAVKKLGISDKDAYSLVGSFTALAYVNSIFGGYIADRMIGYDYSVIAGTLLLCAGYSVLSVLSYNFDFFILGLAIITIGTGMLKPNISSMLSILYKNNPEQKDYGYTLFYIGIYFGAIGGSMIGGYIKEYMGWMAVFASASIGLFIAFLIFSWGRKHYNLYDEREVKVTPRNICLAFLIIIGIIAISYFGLRNEVLSEIMFAIIAVASVAYITYNLFKLQGAARRKLFAFLIFVVISTLYWAIYFQQFFSVSLCTDRVTRLTLPESTLTGFESLGVILFGPLVSWIWFKLQQKQINTPITIKFSLSFLFNAIGFLCLVIGLQYAEQHGILLSQWVIVGCYLLIATGELFIAPIGLSMVSTLTPPALNGAMMGVFLMSIGLGGKLAGILARISSTDGTSDVLHLQYIYSHEFTIFSIMSIAVFVLCLLLVKPLNKLMK